MSLDFRYGVAYYSYFTQLPTEVYGFKFLHSAKPYDIIRKVGDNNYSSTDSGNIDQDKKALDSIDTDARETGYMYQNSTDLQLNLREWINLEKLLQRVKSNIEDRANMIVNDINKYNDNLQKAKEEVCLRQLKDAANNFNNKRKIKKEGQGWIKQNVKYDQNGNETSWTWYYDADEYYCIPNYWTYNDVASLAAAIISMEKESGERILNPRDYIQKLNKSNPDNWQGKTTGD